MCFRALTVAAGSAASTGRWCIGLNFEGTQMKESMPGWSSSSWSGGCGIGWNADCLDDFAQKVSQRYQIRNGSHNAGSYYEFGVYCPGEQLPELWAHVRESDNCERSSKADVKHSFAQRFWNVVGVRYFKLVKFVGHK
jgi:hypothetical protein